MKKRKFYSTKCLVENYFTQHIDASSANFFLNDFENGAMR